HAVAGDLASGAKSANAGRRVRLRRGVDEDRLHDAAGVGNGDHLRSADTAGHLYSVRAAVADPGDGQYPAVPRVSGTFRRRFWNHPGPAGILAAMAIPALV